jgi:hypothetical protein
MANWSARSRGYYSIFDFHVQEPLADARGAAAATVRKRLNTQTDTALIARPGCPPGACGQSRE